MESVRNPGASFIFLENLLFFKKLFVERIICKVYTRNRAKIDNCNINKKSTFNLNLVMKRAYQVPESEALEMILEGEILLSGGKAGEPGRPGGDLDDSYELDDLL